MAANKVCGLRERKCGNNFGRRWRLFKYLVTSVMAYRVKIWEWEEQKNLEKIILNYVRWISRLDFCIHRYIIIRKLGLNKLKMRQGIRAKRYEVKVNNMEENRWVKK